MNRDRSIAEQVSEQLFSLSDHIRYAAVYYNDRLQSVSKPNRSRPDWWDSDKYEELIVNPTLITLLRQRGKMDCGGIQHIVIHYGELTQFVHPIQGGHVSIGFEPKTNHLRLLSKIMKVLSTKKLLDEPHS